MIDPNNVTTIRVGELPTEVFSLTDMIPHEIGTDLKKGSLNDLAIFISAFIGSSEGVGFRAVSVTDGQTLPSTTKEEFILVGKGTYYNVLGGSTLILTEELNAIVSNGSYWFIGVEIPINFEFTGITQEIREGFLDTTPSEDAVFKALALKGNIGEYELKANKQNSLVADGSNTKYPTVTAVNTGLALKENKVQKTINADNYTDSFTGFESDGFNHGSAIWKILNEYNFENVNILLSLKTYKPISNEGTYYTLNNVSIRGVKQPYFEDGLTNLQGGTIIQGGVLIVQPSSNLCFNDFGVDAGKNVTDEFYSGLDIEGFIMSVSPGDGGVLFGENINEKNITTLVRSPYSAKHSHLVERFRSGSLDNIVTCFGIYGFVLKSQYISIGSVKSYGSSVDNVLIKSGEVYTIAGQSTFESIVTGTIPPGISSSYVSIPKADFGLYFEGGVPSSDITINSALIINAKQAVSISPNSVSGVVGTLTINNLSITGCDNGLLRDSAGLVGDVYIGNLNSFNTIGDVVRLKSGTILGDFSIYINNFNTHGDISAINAIKLTDSKLLNIGNAFIANATNAFDIESGSSLIVDNYSIGVNVTNVYAAGSITLTRTNAIDSNVIHKIGNETKNGTLTLSNTGLSGLYIQDSTTSYKYLLYGNTANGSFNLYDFALNRDLMTFYSGNVDFSGNIQALSVTATEYKILALNTAPSSATATGTTGEIRITAGFIYVCIATNTWVRTALATW